MKALKLMALALAGLSILNAHAQTSSNVSVFASGFNNPRGLKFGPDGNLYVAEGGAGGSLSTVGVCEQAAGPPAGPGPYTGDFTARISKVDAHAVQKWTQQFQSGRVRETRGDRLAIAGVALRTDGDRRGYSNRKLTND